MGTTPNFGWTYPAPTNYVKDLPTDLGDLADEIDATVAGLGSGLNLISTQAISTSVSFTNVFNTTYDYYKLVLRTIGTTNGANLQLRARMNTTDYTSTGYYNGGYYHAFNAGGANNNVNNGTGFVIYALPNTGADCTMNIDFYPTTTTLTYSGIGTTSYQGGVSVSGGFVTASSNVTGITLYASSGNLTGSASLYGYKK